MSLFLLLFANRLSASMEQLIAPFPLLILRILEKLKALRQEGIARVIANMTSFASGLGPPLGLY